MYLARLMNFRLHPSANTRRVMRQKPNYLHCATTWVLPAMWWCKPPATAPTTGRWWTRCNTAAAGRAAWPRSSAVSAMLNCYPCTQRACAACASTSSNGWLISRPKMNCWKLPAELPNSAGMSWFILRQWICPSCGIFSPPCPPPWWLTTWAGRMSACRCMAHSLNCLSNSCANMPMCGAKPVAPSG